MTASHTLPIRIPSPQRLHEHAWVSESAHRTSVGETVYVRCVDCGARRVDLRVDDDVPPTPQTRIAGREQGGASSDRRVWIRAGDADLG